MLYDLKSLTLLFIIKSKLNSNQSDVRSIKRAAPPSLLARVYGLRRGFMVSSEKPVGGLAGTASYAVGAMDVIQSTAGHARASSHHRRKHHSD